MTPEEAVAAFFAQQVPAPRDLVFETRVGESIARRRAIATVLALFPWMLATLVVGWAVGPILAPAFDVVTNTLAPAASLLGMTAVLIRVLMAGSRLLAPR